MSIRFYSTKGEHGGFSNFSRHTFDLDGAWWPTSEHFFQAFWSIRHVGLPRSRVLCLVFCFM